MSQGGGGGKPMFRSGVGHHRLWSQVKLVSGYAGGQTVHISKSPHKVRRSLV
jgi:hypothetical protein